MSLFGAATLQGPFQKNVPRNPRTIFRLKQTSVDQAVNDTYFDDGPNNVAITSNGTAARSQGGFSPFSAPFGDWSIQLANTAGEALHPYIAAAASLATGTTADFTWECFVMRTRYNTFNTISSINASGQVTVRLTTGGASNYSGPGAHTATKCGKWVHYALVRKAGVFCVYIGGVLMSQTTGNAGNLQFSGGPTSAAFIGDYNANTNQDWLGYISNMRIVIGTALYDGQSFTPPTSGLTAVANTKFLGFCGPAMIDYSGNGNTFVYGTTPPRVVPIGPFGDTDLTSYAPETHGGSYYCTSAAYLSGAADASNAFGTGDFTIEFWTYLTAQANNGVLAGAWSGTASTSAWLVSQGSNAGNSGLRVGLSNGSALTFVESTVTGLLRPYSWVHVMVTRSNGTLYMFLNGIQVYSAANSINVSSTIAALGIMATSAGASGSTGYISNLRVSNVARATAAFALPTAPVGSDANTTLLLNFKNGQIYDDSRKSSVILGGDAKVVADPTAPGTDPYAIAFDGTGDYLQWTSASMNTTFGNDGEATIEFWVKFNNAAASNFWFFDCGTYGLQRNTANKLVWTVSTAGTARLTSTAVVSATGTWMHIAIVRVSGLIRLFINGVLDSQVTEADILGDTTANMEVFRIGSKVNGTLALNGSVKGFNMVRYPKYISNFTPAGDLL